jgi:hypothetical protein
MLLGFLIVTGVVVAIFCRGIDSGIGRSLYNLVRRASRLESRVINFILIPPFVRKAFIRDVALRGQH